MGLSDEQKKLAGIIPNERGAFTCTGAARPPQAPGDSAINPRTTDEPWLKSGAFLRPLFSLDEAADFTGPPAPKWTPEPKPHGPKHRLSDRDLATLAVVVGYKAFARAQYMSKETNGEVEYKADDPTIQSLTNRKWLKVNKAGSIQAAKTVRNELKKHRKPRGYSHVNGSYFADDADEAKRETFKAAKARLLEYLQSQGWAVKPHLKIPRADEFVGGYHTSLWFKPQAIYIGMSSHTNPTFNHARSMHMEIRGMSGEKFLKEVEKEAHDDTPTHGSAWGESIDEKAPADSERIAGTDYWVSGEPSRGPIRGQKAQYKIYNKHGGVVGGAPDRKEAIRKAKGMKSRKREGVEHALQSLRGIGMLRQSYTDDTADEFAAALKRGLKAPWIQVSVSKLGGPGRHSVMMKLSLDPESEWNNKILHNSRYAMFAFDGGKIEQHARHYKLLNFRKSKYKDVQDAIKKINKWIAKAEAA